MMWLLYDLLMMALALITLPRYALQRRLNRQLLMRLGWYPEAVASRLAEMRPTLWLHAVSLGEVSAVRALYQRLKAQYPTWRIVFSTITPTGYALTERIITQDDVLIYCPLDLSWIVQRAFARIQPSLLILTETELWPNLLRCAEEQQIPVVIVNGRLSDRGWPMYQRLRRAFAPRLRGIARCCAQSARDAERFAALGVPADRVRVPGNLKYDVAATTMSAQAIEALRSKLGLTPSERLLIAGSTHPGEETLIAEAYRRVREAVPHLRLLVAPRHIERCDDAERALREQRLSVVRYTHYAPLSSAVMLLDVMGELANLYAVADVVVMGGSFVRKGGQNPIEPAALAKPVVVGPHMENFRAITQELLDAQAIIQVPDERPLAERLGQLLQAPEASAAMGRRAAEVVARQRGATDRTLAAIVEVLREPSLPMLPEVPLPPEAHLRRYAVRLMQDEATGLAARLMRVPLRVASWGYRWATQGVTVAYRRGWLSSARVDAPVISVGNLTVGGTGKTSLVAVLARRCREAGRSVAILSRGYGGTQGDGAYPLLYRGDQITTLEGRHLAMRNGLADEPLLLARALQDVPVLVDPRRSRSAHWAIERLGADCLILDDGFQHWRLRRDLDIVLVDATRLFGNQRLLPRGILREQPSALRRAHIIVLTKTDRVADARPIRETLQRFFPQAIVAEAVHRAVGLLDPATQRVQPVSHLHGRRVGAVSAVGDPAAFEATLQGLKTAVAVSWRYPDHFRFGRDDVAWLLRQAARYDVAQIVTTAKDWVRLASPVKEAGRRLAWFILQVELQFVTKEDEQRVVDRCCAVWSR
ncbi:MAG: tetraacyldisaccharide 4'-kinase [Candidatus Omnitrophica bacterium]|nr:tetraacyldisaccharide 4'-kinase [Candidatus Omnitrophota bacterium]